MSQGKNKYAVIILARAGSKRVIGKNMRVCGGKPLLEWNLLAATQSKYVDRVFVSTDGEDMKKLAEGYGATVLDRPYQLFADDIGCGPVMVNAIQQIYNSGYEFTHFIDVRPTSPLIEAINLDEGIELFESTPSAEALGCAFPSKKSCTHMLHIHVLCGGMLVNVFGLPGPPEIYGLLEYYITNGGFGIRSIKNIIPHILGKKVTDDMKQIDINALYEKAILAIQPEGMFKKAATTVGYILPQEKMIDVNTEFDIKLVDLLLTERENEKNGR